MAGPRLLTWRAHVQLKDDNMEASGQFGDQPLNVPKAFRGHAGIVLPMVQMERATEGHSGPRHGPRCARCAG